MLRTSLYKIACVQFHLDYLDICDLNTKAVSLSQNADWFKLIQITVDSIPIRCTVITANVNKHNLETASLNCFPDRS